MKKLSLFNKIIFFANSLFALVTLIAIIAPYLSINLIPTLSTISLVVPILIYINVGFLVYWMLKRKKQAFVSVIILGLWYFTLGPFYQFSEGDKVSEDSNSFSIMSFNSRGFNKHEQLKIKNVDSLIIDFISTEKPDIVCFQECHYAMKRSNDLSQYDYKYVDFIYGEHSGKVIQAIYSKYPILEVNSIDFPRSSNTAIYADILFKTDTVRLYNIHLQSFRIIPEISAIQNEESAKLVSRLSKAMLKQNEQAKLIRANMELNSYKKIVVGDFNNTQYSNIYRTIKGDLQDTFLEKGKGFGRTYNLLGFPIRIDYIFADSDFEVISHQNFDVKLSDHYPVMSTLRLKSDQ